MKEPNENLAWLKYFTLQFDCDADFWPNYIREFYNDPEMSDLETEQQFRFKLRKEIEEYDVYDLLGRNMSVASM